MPKTEVPVVEVFDEDDELYAKGYVYASSESNLNDEYGQWQWFSDASRDDYKVVEPTDQMVEAWEYRKEQVDLIDNFLQKVVDDFYEPIEQDRERRECPVCHSQLNDYAMGGYECPLCRIQVMGEMHWSDPRQIYIRDMDNEAFICFEYPGRLQGKDAPDEYGYPSPDNFIQTYIYRNIFREKTRIVGKVNEIKKIVNR